MSTYLDNGYTNLLNVDQAAPITQINESNSEAVISDGTIGYEQTSLSTLYTNQDIRSSNFRTGSAGWEIKGNGSAEFANVVIRGTIYATAGSIGGIEIDQYGIQTADFVSGPLGKGFRLTQDGLAEFQNIVARGKITTAVFEKQAISAIGGYLLVSGSDALAEDMTALDSSKLTTTNVQFAVNEVIRIKDGTDDEWMTVTAVDGYEHTVTRDLASDYTSNNNPAWQAGTAVVSMASLNKGVIEMDTATVNSPKITVKTRESATYNDFEERVIIGNLKDKTGEDEYGVWTDNGYFQGEIVGSDLYIPNKTTPKFSVDSNGRCTVSSFFRKDIHWFTIFESIDGYTQPGTGTVALGDLGLNIESGATTNDQKRIRKTINYGTTWDVKRAIRVCISGYTASSAIHYIGTGYLNNTTDRNFGFRIVNGTLYGHTGDGTYSESANYGSIGGTTILEAEFLPGDKISYYKDGNLLGYIDTNLPSGSSNSELVFSAWTQTLEDDNKEMSIYWYDFWQEEDAS
jgi:hypothetical protein